ncbi:dehydrogenase [Paenibacillus swuensis]|uniref:Dehydrogenase n=1 Tax=Paenibacillus swuensis TaxID=1178515 RepID=A0A172TFX7_9BACL|nr:Gfo/Idh/MocA family oxidoreductase [Paenibacillus swuensis]ANE45910.1 dehydrogenase [Paenibacillus swuensis]
MNTVGIGLVGYKKMGRAHSFAYRNVNAFFETAVPRMEWICGRDPEALASMAANFGWKGITRDWKELLRQEEVDLVDICAPNRLHDEIVVEAARFGKHVLVEKPIALNGDRARAMTEAVLKAEQDFGMRHAVCFNYRYVPAVQLAKQLIDEGKIGQIYHFRGRFLQDWLVDSNAPATWRLDKTEAGSGALGDLGSHIIDLARYLVGDIAEVSATARTFIYERPVPGSDALHSVTVDDATAALLQFANGALGTLEATRYATGHKCTNEFEISGSRGSVRFNFQQLNELEYFTTEDASHVQGYRKITVTRPGIHPYAEGWWGPGHVIGFENTFVHLVKDVLDAVSGRRLTPALPTCVDGLRCQEVVEAVESAIENRTWAVVKHSGF